eukprot:Phypoly_transcript_02888.p1 GENE.Phypoly_transcript_02888~~Phypoly_transcript_02888.p1  ORF type:complete len:815 (+),score=218.80 Phypoly_transcript_02888:68-2512(+)
MGKKKGKQKSKASAAKPKDGRTLPFLQDMFPNVEKDIVSIIFEQNEYDEEKTIQQLEELSLNDGSKPAAFLYDEEDVLVGVETSEIDVADSMPSLPSTPSKTTATTPTANKQTPNKRQTPPKSSPFISTYEDDISSFESTSNFPFSLAQLPATTTSSYSTPITSTSTTTSSTSTYTSTPTPTISTKASATTPPTMRSTKTTTSFTTPTTTSTSSTNHSQIPSYESGDSKHFLASMFPELDSTMVALLYDENGNDVGKTVESLLSIVFMNHSSGGAGEVDEDEAEAEENDSEENSGNGNGGEAEEANDDDYDDVTDEDLENIQIEIPRSTTTTNDNSAVKSDFIVNLNLLAELFPDTPRTLLALELDEHDCDLEKTIASCCRADPEYLRRLSGVSKATQEIDGIAENTPKKAKKNKCKEKATVVSPVKEDKPKGPAAVDSILKPNWVGAGTTSAHLINNTPKVKYVKSTKPSDPKPASEKPEKSEKGKGKEAAQKSAASPRRRGMDLAAKLKLKQLREKFNFVDADILEAVFVQSGHKVQATLLCLYDIYPHLREHAAAPANASYAHALDASPPGSPEQPLSRKREKPDASAAGASTQTQAQANGEKPRKTKRTKPAEEGGDAGEGEFVTVSYRKKRAEPSANGAPTPNKKVMDSDDIENAYQNYREQAIKNGEMRNLMFMQAAAAYQAGDGARARALSQRGREYDEMMKESHRQACHQIFLDCNARLDTLASIDLHGLHVAEALQVISQLLEIHAQMGETGNKTKKLRVITGQGRHSLHGIAKIKPAVKNFLRSKGYTFVEADAGVITISLSKF